MSADDLAVDGEAPTATDGRATDGDGIPRLFLSDGCTAQRWREGDGPRHGRIETQTHEGSWGGGIQPETGDGASGPTSLHPGLGETSTLNSVTVTTVDGRSGRVAGDIAPGPALRVGPEE